ncbi:hypothetical protein DXT89_20605 [Agrobacterium vitis]|uniref:Uncharacterized protein n=1 Tax=Agrobacterium vitis TaxID=373 RepID=A0A368NKS3_AGRVI|nr:hypothetical protein DXM22_19555 [Agrobacterium vitis]KAA3523360.1 hypothetical protein DXT89_20605 [Agrobacterium vitis]MCF1479122.1 hypothetical protein [Agrobacterium vitis]RCU51207.1 hypothetical protein ASB66_019750 [Agrobacterium vitis]
MGRVQDSVDHLLVSTTGANENSLKMRPPLGCQAEHIDRLWSTKDFEYSALDPTLKCQHKRPSIGSSPKNYDTTISC